MQNLKTKQVKIRKPHKCWGCMQLFPIGTEMEYNASTDGGEICSSYWCESCQKLLNEVDWTDFEDGIGFGELKEYMEETK